MNRDTFADIQPTRALVYVLRKKLNFVSLRLEQAFGQHHSFMIKADFDALGQEFMSDPKQHLSLIGQTVDIELQQGNDNAKAYMFRGIIQKAAVRGQEGKHGYLVFSGASPTILMEKGKRFDVFTNLTLKQVVRQLTEDIVNYQTALPVVNNPAYTGQVEFLMQYGESDWQFLRRLSSIAKENMYWTGRELVFGMHDDFPTLEVTYDREITSYEFSYRFLPNNFTRYQYLPGKDETLTKDAPERIKGANGYINSAHEEGKIIAEKRPVRTPLDLNVFDVGSLGDMVEREKTGRAAETVVIEGTSKTAHPRIGRLLKIKMPDTMKGAAELGTFRITKVVHEFIQNDRYECYFEGIPADLKHYPLLDVEIPVAKSVLGTVISNADPDGQGRVRVDFPFASDRVSDAWLRVMTPNAGSSKKVEKNRGMVFIPEADDQVMVDFEFGDPNRPYVTGSMFHGKNGMGGGGNNAIKSITLRSGSTLTFTDKEDEKIYSVLLRHNEQNSISVHVDKDEGTITIESSKDIYLKAPELIQMEAKQIIMKGEIIQATAEDTIEMVAQNLLHAESADKVEILGATIAEESSGEFTQQGDHIAMKASSNVDVDGGGKINLKGGDIKMNQ